MKLVKRSILIFSFSFMGILSCKESHPEGIWIRVKDKQMTSKNGYVGGFMGMTVDFDKLETRFISNPLDSVIRFTIDYKSNQILDENDTLKIPYKLFGKDSLELYFEAQNSTLVLIPLRLDHKLDTSKEQIIEALTQQKIYSVNDTLNIEFSNTFLDSDYFNRGIQNKRNLTSFFPNRVFEGYWYIWEKDKNYFFVFNPDTYDTMEYILQIIAINQNKISLKEIAASQLAIDFKELTAIQSNDLKPKE